MECLNGWARGEGQGHERGTDPHSRLVKTKENPEEQKIGRRGLVADPEERRTSVGAEAELEDWRTKAELGSRKTEADPVRLKSKTEPGE